jgi:hypothetical protein
VNHSVLTCEYSRFVATFIISQVSDDVPLRLTRQQNNQDEGHGFSRAVNRLRLTASAAEVRFSRHIGRSHLFPLRVRDRRLEDVPQGLKCVRANSVPQGRLKNAQDCIEAYFQLTLRD